MVKMVRWNPRNRTPDRSFDDMINDLWRAGWIAPRAYNDTARPQARPAMDVIENDNEVTIRVDLPGLASDDINIEIDGDLLTISGELIADDEIDNTRYHYRERSLGSFKRSLRLADTLDTEHIEATFDNGVLSIVLPKLPELQPKRIKVETA